ncbi:NADP-dependent malic enzyme-like isoform X3 [Xenia sp. Carnegie-2017]|uniref:NADP-dependent malic enzyme-like isoform X3 n=1 Tax=Xenia sp. Carnegie-2017 TaxID=2897299 RepID=UPI001F033F3C|nr:NADP-dependent malic enzyme-like isoform X3 [Xenia sp. Carnegie-2017]
MSVLSNPTKVTKERTWIDIGPKNSMFLRTYKDRSFCILLARGRVYCRSEESMNNAKCSLLWGNGLAKCSRTAQRYMSKIPSIQAADIMRDPRLNKGTGFPLEERQILGIHGLLPPTLGNQELQAQRIMLQLSRKESDLHKYLDLMALLQRNERLFYRVLMDNLVELMPVVYTPTVGKACQKYGEIFTSPKGLFISIKDKGHVNQLVGNWPEQNVKELLGDPFYVGIREKRVRGEEYNELIDETIHALTDRFGKNTLIQFEDFGNHNAFHFLEKYRSKICTFNDDIQGTAAVAVAGVLASQRLSKKNRLSDNTFVFLGAGEAAIGISNLLVLAMKEEGLDENEARGKISLIDSKGLVVKDRTVGGLTETKLKYAHETGYIDNLLDAVNAIKPSVLIGVAAVPGSFNEDVCRTMASLNDRPVIFALSNPTSKSECSAEQAYTWTKGKCVFASGSPFSSVTLADGLQFTPGQGNNCYIFPGVALGTIVSGAQRVSESIFLEAAKSLASQVSEEQLLKGCIYPPLADIRQVSVKIAAKVAEHAYKTGLATVLPEPKDKIATITEGLYSPEYISFVPRTYVW